MEELRDRGTNLLGNLIPSVGFFLAGDSCGLTQSTRSDGGRTKQNKEV